MAALAAVPSRAFAQSFIAPFLGYDVGGDAGTCPSLVHDCSEKKSGYGVALGLGGGLIGFEEDLAFAPDFYGKSATFGDNSVLTLMSNLAVKIPTPVLQPYVSGGAGLMRSHTGLSLSGLTAATSDNAFGYDIGGGVMLMLPYHLGVRADVRTLRSLNDVTIAGVALPNAKLNFSRVSIGLMIH